MKFVTTRLLTFNFIWDQKDSVYRPIKNRANSLEITTSVNKEHITCSTPVKKFRWFKLPFLSRPTIITSNPSLSSAAHSKEIPQVGLKICLRISFSHTFHAKGEIPKSNQTASNSFRFFSPYMVRFVDSMSTMYQA